MNKYHDYSRVFVYNDTCSRCNIKLIECIAWQTERIQYSPGHEYDVLWCYKCKDDYLFKLEEMTFRKKNTTIKEEKLKLKQRQQQFYEEKVHILIKTMVQCILEYHLSSKDVFKIIETFF